MTGQLASPLAMHASHWVTPHFVSSSPASLRVNPRPIGVGGVLIQCCDLTGTTTPLLAHALFIRYARVFAFIVNLERIWKEETRVEEIRQLCRWMQLVFALSDDPTATRAIVVGSRKPECVELQAVWHVLYEGLMDELGDAPFDEWISGRAPSCDPGSDGIFRYPTIQGSAGGDLAETGLENVERLVRDAALEFKQTEIEVPSHWEAFLKELWKVEAIRPGVWTKGDISSLAEEFPHFGGDKETREEGVLCALRYLREQGRLAMFEVSSDEYYVFVDPSAIMNFINRLTEPGAQYKLKRRNGVRLRDEGLLTHEGLATLWDGHSAHVRSALLDLLCKFDLLIRLKGSSGPGEKSTELIGVPSLLPSNCKGFRWAPKPGEIELHLKTKFYDTLPPGLVGSLIANLHRTVGGEQTESGHIAPDAAVLSVALSLSGAGRVCVAFDDSQRQLTWVVRAKEPLRVAHACLRALDNFLKGALRDMRIELEHCISCSCQEEPHGCGDTASVDFELPESWTTSKECQPLGNLRAICFKHKCREPWVLSELLPDVARQAIESPVVGPMFVRRRIEPCDVFISHAGSEKEAVAIPLHEALTAAGLNTFLDENDIHVSTATSEEQIFASMRGSKAAVFILSPNFIARKWPVRELRYFLELRAAAQREGRGNGPVIIPLFYGLQWGECKNRELPFSERYRQCFINNGFFEDERQRKCSAPQAMEAIRTLAQFCGIRNDIGESDEEFARRAAAKIVTRFRRRNR